MEERLRALDKQIAHLASTTLDQKTRTLLETLPGFGPINVAKILAWLPNEILHSGSNRKVAARLQAFMGNDPRLRQSGQWKGHTKMSKRGVEMLRTRRPARPGASRLLPAQTSPRQKARGRYQSSYAHPHPQTGCRPAFGKTLLFYLQLNPTKCRLKELQPVIACLQRLVRPHSLTV